jgi:transcriptional regulator with XRE-family HTH domain
MKGGKMGKYTVEQARKLSNLSIRETAKLLGLSQNAYFKKEKGLSRFYYDEAIKFSSITNIPLDNIFFTSNVTQK